MDISGENPTNCISVLLVEDEKIVQFTLTAMLKKFGCKVDLAATGKEALSKSTINYYDIIFMDIGLPDMRGSEVTTAIRRKETCKRTPIIAVTGYPKTEIEDECITAGIDAIYNKPLSLEQIQKILIHRGNKTFLE